MASIPEEVLMEKRLGVIALIIENRESAQQFNRVVSEFHDLVLARQGVPLHDRYGDGRDLHVISLVVEGTTDALGALTGRLGKLPGVQVKSVLSKARPEPAGGPDADSRNDQNLH
jgi:putative iron-only hydrogenase system regulator